MKNFLKYLLFPILIFLSSFSFALGAINIVPNGGTGVGTITGPIIGNGTSPFSPAVSGTDFKTVNGTSILGSGNIVTPAGTVTSVSGTANRITSTGGVTPVIDISATFEALLGKVATGLQQFAATTSLQLAGVISDETGSGALVFGTSPAISGGTLTTSSVNGVTLTTGGGTTTFLNANGAYSTPIGTVYTGTTNRITVTGTVLDIAATYVGQSSITTLGTITTGVWNGTAIANANLANSTISGIALGGTLNALTATNTSLTFSGSYDGSTARTVGLNLSNANTWTGKQTFNTSGPRFGTITGSTQCLHVDTNGDVTGTGSDCGSGSGGVSTIASADGSITVTGTTAIDLAVVKAPIWSTARLLAGNSVNGSANVAFANKFIVQGTTDTGLSGAQFLGALGTGLVKNTTTTGVLSIAASGTDYELPLTFSTGLTRSTNTITVNTSQNISTLSNLTSNGLVTTSGSTGALSVTVPGTGVLTALGVNVGSAGAFVTFNGALGTPSSGTVTNLTGTASININGTVGATTPAAGTFTSVTDSGLTSTRVTFSGTSGLLSDDAGFIFTAASDLLTLGENGQDGSLKIFAEDGATDHSTIFNPGTQTQDIIYTLPVDDGTSGQQLQTDGTGVLSWAAAGGSLVVGTTAITSGTTTRILYDNAGVLGEYTLTGTGTVVAMQTAPSFLTSITTPSVLASSNDSGALGASGTAFADLFLASGGVINWNAGNATITHSTGLLTSNVPFAVPDDAYASTWDASVNVPTKNAVYDANFETDNSIKAYQLLGSVVKGQTVGINIASIDTSGAILTDNVARYVAVYLSRNATITGLKWYQFTSGIYTADQNNYVALYSYSGGTLTQVAITANDGNIWKATGNTLSSAAFTTPYAAAPGIYFVGILWNASATTTVPTLGSGRTLGSSNITTLDFTNSAKISGTIATQNTLPSSQVSSGLGATTGLPWIALY